MIITENDRCYEIRQIAIELLKVHNINTSTAIDIRELITSTGRQIKWKVLDLKGLSGFTCLNTKNNSYCMFFDEKLICDCPTRLNFTMAHELGHIVLDHFSNADSSIIMDYFKEREANIFVDELLMPTAQIMKKSLVAWEVAETYNVSVPAAKNKLKFLNQNSIYHREKALEFTYEFLNRKPKSIDYHHYNKRMVRVLHDRWLDPDYSIL